jgi:hypothetical protein
MEVDYESQLMRLLEDNYHSDASRGFTSFGPHRDDIIVRLGGASATVFDSMSLCGIFEATTASSKSIRIRLTTNTGTVFLNNNSLTDSEAIEWSIFQLDQEFPAPVLTGAVTTSGTTYSDHIERASMSAVCTTGTCTLANNTPGISGVSRSATGRYDIAFVAGTFSTTPTCVMQIKESNGGTTSTIGNQNGGTYSSTAYHYGCVTSGLGADIDCEVDILCMGQRP